MRLNRLTLPLLELGVPVVGSSGRIGADGKPFMRTIPDLLGITFENSGIEFVGTFNDLDFEKITGLNPDLIFTRRKEHIEPLSRIAPTLFIDPNNHPIKDGIRIFAEATGRTKAYNRLLRNYKSKLAIA
ncbi:MAG: ABC transporter substrate-binding protein [Rhizobiales bacterium]|nr:ABC transporter substrate-binding protein [Hyphomicrobiales bacterium]